MKPRIMAVFRPSHPMHGRHATSKAYDTISGRQHRPPSARAVAATVESAILRESQPNQMSTSAVPDSEAWTLDYEDTAPCPRLLKSRSDLQVPGRVIGAINHVSRFSSVARHSAPPAAVRAEWIDGLAKPI